MLRFLLPITFSLYINTIIPLLSKPHYTIIIDPGHGSAISTSKDERWDSISKEYISFSNYGSQYKNYHEHKIVLDLGKQIKFYLDLTCSPKTWQRFQNHIRPFLSNSTSKYLPQVCLRTHLTRNNSAVNTKQISKNPNINAPYLMFDYPLKKNSKHMELGRISRINQKKPHLLVSLHLTSAGKGHKGGMAAVLSPSYKTFNLLRKISLNKNKKRYIKLRNQFRHNPWQPYWLVTRKNWSRFQSAWSDAWVYFHGYNTRKDSLRNDDRKYYRGIRHNLVTWRYADPPGWELQANNNAAPYSKGHRRFRAKGTCWKREQRLPEQWRREEKINGNILFGGDNHYAANELLRFVQFGIRIFRQKYNNKKKLPPLPGPIQTPYVSSYALPIYVNAITAYLELGYINRKNDRHLLTLYRDIVAQSIAVGIYSLFAGLQGNNKLRSGYKHIRPRGQRINWERYEKWKLGNYFKRATL